MFCELCIEGKIQHQSCPTDGGNLGNKLLGLIHSDVCGLLNIKSLGWAKYFLTCVDDKTRYVWVHMLQHKSEVFKKLTEWKALVENSSGHIHVLKTLHTDNGGECVN